MDKRSMLLSLPVSIGTGAMVALMLLTSQALAGDQCSEATRVRLEKDCAGLTDCFTSLSQLEDWIWDQNTDPTNRCTAPDADDRLLIDVGLGTFNETPTFGSGVFNCPDGDTISHGYFTMRGSGKDQSFLVGEGQVLGGVTLKFNFCTEVTVQDLTVINENGVGIYWLSGGTSQWTNLNLIAGTFGWYDGSVPCATPKGVHYWFSAKIESRNTAYRSSCDENWIFGSDVVLRVGDTPPDAASAVLVFNEGDVRLFGSTVRIDASAVAASTPIDLYGVQVGSNDSHQLDGNGVFHMHGGIVSVNATGVDDADLTGVQVQRGTSGAALAHIVDTAFAINDKTAPTPNVGETKRVELLPAGTSIKGLQSPFQWPASETPPLQDRLQSANGYDQYVETDCQDDGLCDQPSPTEKHPHLMIYDESCDVAPYLTPWFDTTTNRCRNDSGGALTK